MSIEDGPGDTLDVSESLDQDEVRGADGEVVTPPDQWSAADKFGTTEAEAREGESLDDKLAEEVPDVPLEDESDVPVAATPDDELTEELVDTVVDSDDEATYAPIDDDESVRGDTVRHADVVDGTVVEDSRVDRGQVSGTPEDGTSLYD